MSNAANPLLTHPLVLKFVDEVTNQFDLNSDEDVVDKDGWVEVQPMNPPYGTVKYIACFVDDLIDALTKCGFKRHGMEPEIRTMRCGNIEARIENVDGDPEEGDPIVVEFWEV